MEQETHSPSQFKGYPSRGSWLLVNSILFGGLALPPLLGLIAVMMLQSRGVQTVELARGFSQLIPLMFLTEIPYALLALAVSKVLKSWTPDEPPSISALLSVSVGAALGLSFGLGYLILGTRLSERGLGEAVGMMLALWVFTVPLFLIVGTVGAIVGGAAGAVFCIGLAPLRHRIKSK